MTPDDPRHGSVSGYKYHACRCEQCRSASVRYEKGRRWLVHQGLNPSIPAHGFKRRVHALMAIGWTQRDIAKGLGIATGNLSAKLRLNDTVRRATHEAMCALYEANCMTTLDGMVNRRTAQIAAKRGWAPPLAWDDIDDPDETPNLGAATADHATARRIHTPEVWAEFTADRIEDLEFLADAGVSIEEAARRIDSTVDGLETWLKRQSRSDLFRRMRPRDPNADRNRNWDLRDREKGSAA